MDQTKIDRILKKVEDEIVSVCTKDIRRKHRKRISRELTKQIKKAPGERKLDELGWILNSLTQASMISLLLVIQKTKLKYNGRSYYKLKWGKDGKDDNGNYTDPCPVTVDLDIYSYTLTINYTKKQPGNWFVIGNLPTKTISYKTPPTSEAEAFSLPFQFMECIEIVRRKAQDEKNEDIFLELPIACGIIMAKALIKTKSLVIEEFWRKTYKDRNGNEVEGGEYHIFTHKESDTTGIGRKNNLAKLTKKYIQKFKLTEETLREKLREHSKKFLVDLGDDSSDLSNDFAELSLSS